jgi:DEAD/DEAH box helicase domain-containing protein
MDKIVLDIETKNSFADVGGRDNFDALQVSLVGLYSYDRDEYFALEEHELDKLEDILSHAGLVIGFALKRFDFPVLRKHVPFDIFKIKYLDILEEIEMRLGRRIGLDALAQANLGFGKNGDGLEAIRLYKEGKIDELKKYCLQDVKVTKEVYDYAMKKRELVVPSWRTPFPDKITIDWVDEVLPQATLF